MARPSYAEAVHGGLPPLLLTRSASTTPELAPFPELDALWHYDCVLSPRSPASKPQSNPPSLRSPAVQSPDERISPRSPAWKMELGSVSAHLPPISLRCDASSSSAAPSPLSRFAPAQKALSQRLFSTFDENGDGSVSAQEISRMFEKLGLSTSEDPQPLLADIPSLVHKTEGHDVDEEEFLLLYESACCLVDASASSSSVIADVDQDLLAAFHVFDKDGNGFISPAELQSVLCSLGFLQGRQLEACVDMIARVDANNDGQVDFFEFKKLLDMGNPFKPVHTSQTF